MFVGWFGFYGISNLGGYLMPNPFYTNKLFYFKQFSLAWVHSLIVKTFLFQAIQSIQTVIIPTIQFSMSIVFVQKKVKCQNSFQTIQFSVRTVSVSKTVLFQTIQFSISMQYKYCLLFTRIKMSKQFYFR